MVALIVIALGLYLAGVAITAAGNVPLNNELADRGAVSDEEAIVARLAFEADWNRLNLLRTVAVVGSFGALTAATAAKARLASRRREERTTTRRDSATTLAP